MTKKIMDMVALCDKIEKNTSGNWINDVTIIGHEKQLTQTLDDLDQLTALEYDEQRIEQILQQVKAEVRKKFLEIIKEENQINEDEELAIRLIYVLRRNAKHISFALESGNVGQGRVNNEIVQYLNNLQKLLQKNEQIMEAVGTIAKDLEKAAKQIEDV